MNLLEVNGLSFDYGAGPLISGLSFSAAAGDFVCVLGPNGCGKSTLLKLLTGYLKAAPGAVRLSGEDVSRLGSARLARLAAYVPSEIETPYDFSVRETVLMGRLSRSGPWRGYGPEDAAAADSAMAETGVAALAGRSIVTLSSGERQLVFIAQALAQEAGLLLLDEPTSHLDVRYKSDIMALLARLAGKGLAVAAVLHEPALAAMGCTKALLMERGGRYSFGPSSEMLSAARLAAAYGLPEGSPLLAALASRRPPC